MSNGTENPFCTINSRVFNSTERIFGTIKQSFVPVFVYFK